MKKKFVAICPHYWGSAPTEAQALREVRRQGAAPGVKFFLYEVDGEFEISPIDGTLYTEKGKPPRKVREGKLPK